MVPGHTGQAADITQTASIEPVLVITSLHKHYADTPALDGISLSVHPQEIYGLIGPDGAGKTTLMRIACSLLLSDKGEARILGFDCNHQAQRIKEHLGYMPQRFSLYPDLTVAENLRFFADLYEVPGDERRRRENRLLEFSGLGPFRSRRAGQLSGGMKQKLALSCTLIHTPRVLVLDEPTTGVDVISRREFWEILRSLADEGMALLVSTPYMDEAERFDHVALMHRGRAIATGAPDEIAGQVAGHLLEITGRDQFAAWQRLRRKSPVGCTCHRVGDRLHVLCRDSGAVREVEAHVQSLDVVLREVPPSIEDAFVALVSARETT